VCAKSNETAAHRRLKVLALEWARAEGWRIGAAEVRVPKSGYRADVAVIGRGPKATGAVFECKQARADLLKDAHDDAATRRKLSNALRRRAKLEQLLGGHRPDLRRGDSLFAEYDAWEFGALEHKGYHTLLTEITQLQGRLVDGTKFAKMLRYQSADFLYLVVEDDIFAQAEIPAGWGLLVRRDDGLELRRKPARLQPSSAQRHALLESIAMAGTAAARRDLKRGASA
jgi:hypothetical protein